MPDTHAVSSTADALPAWDLADLYPAPDAPQVEADFAAADKRAQAFAAAYAGKLAGLSGTTLAAAIAEYEQIEEVLGRLLSYAQLALRRRFHRCGDRPLLPDQSMNARPPSVPTCCSSPWS